MQSFKYFLKNSHGIRRLGSAATDIAYVSCGRLDAFYEYGLHPWDVAAATLILERAGGRTGDFSGGDNWMYGEEIITCNAKIYDEFLHLINRMMVQEQILIQ
jgi:myo-inositol-1(or 4)-monophosphatase